MASICLFIHYLVLAWLRLSDISISSHYWALGRYKHGLHSQKISSRIPTCHFGQDFQQVYFEQKRNSFFLGKQLE
jgi:hypothetical protein